MQLQPVIDQFAQFARLDGAAAGEWAPLCRAAAARIEKMRKQPVAQDGNQPPEASAQPPEEEPEDDPRLVLAAAGEAFYRYTLLRSGGDASSFKVGDISVTQASETGGSAGARLLRDELLADAAGLLEAGFAGLKAVDG